MRLLASALAEAGAAGEPLPAVWREFVEQGVEFRRGGVTLIGAAPGGAKSVLALRLAVMAGVPTLYHSADTDAFTVSTRLASMLSGDPVTLVAAALQENNQHPKYRKLVDGVKHIQFDFLPNPSIDDVAENVKAFEILYGEMPHLIVVDNLRNMYSAHHEETPAFRENMELLSILAIESKAAVIVLHHLTGAYEGGELPPDQGAFEGKIAKLPSMALTMFRGKYGDIGVCVVKNRFGPADSMGKRVRCYLDTDLERMRLG